MNLAPIIYRHTGPLVPIAWVREAGAKLPTKVLLPKAPAKEALTAALLAIANGAESVDLWSQEEQQYACSVRPGDSFVDDGISTTEEIVPAATTTKHATRGGEYYPNPDGTDASTLSKELALTFEAFLEAGSATVAQIAAKREKSTDVIASHATRLKGLGLLVKEQR